MIRIRDLKKRFGRQAVLDGISVGIGDGESVALWGANGAGKTTILRCICGLYDFTGTTEVDGIDARQHGKLARQRVGYVPQEAGLYPDLRAWEVLDFFARLRGITNADVAGMLRTVGLQGQERKRVRECSGGMKQRLSLATALLGNPGVLLLDEVTASLDSLGRRELVGLLVKLARGHDSTPRRTVLFASHRVEEIAALATRVLVLSGGKIDHDLSVADFVEQFGQSTVLHLLMDLALTRQAVEMLTGHGFTAKVNGRGILVPVREGNRMEPIRILHEARVPIRDFEVLQSDSGGAA